MLSIKNGLDFPVTCPKRVIFYTEKGLTLRGNYMIILKEQRAYEFQHFVIMQAVCPVQAELRPGLCLTFCYIRKR